MTPKKYKISVKDGVKKLRYGRGDDPHDQAMVRLGSELFLKDSALIIAQKLRKYERYYE